MPKIFLSRLMVVAKLILRGTAKITLLLMLELTVLLRLGL